MDGRRSDYASKASIAQAPCRMGFCLAVVLVLAAVQHVNAETTSVSSAHSLFPSAKAFIQKHELQFEGGIGTWLSTGSTRWSHNSKAALLGNPTSELNYKDLRSNIFELRGEITLKQKWFLRANYGFGDITGGRLIDDDYVSQAGAVCCTTLNRPHRFSRTFSDVNGSDLWYVNADLGYKGWSFFHNKASLRAFLGYQHWREKVEATGVTQVECTSPGVECNPVGTVSNYGQTVITNTVTWNSLRLGLEGGYQFLSRFRLDASVVYIPYTWMTNEDIHHLRTDLQKSPSFSMSGTGEGVNVDGTGRFMIFPNLFFSLGYRYWWLGVTDGTWTNHPINAATTNAQLNQLQTFRQGYTLSLDYKF